MAKLEGTIAVAGLPPHRGLIVNLCFFPVGAADSPTPYGGDPPGEAVTDSYEVFKQVDLNTESSRSAYDLPVAVESQPGSTTCRCGPSCSAPRLARCSPRPSSFSSPGGRSKLPRNRSVMSRCPCSGRRPR